LKSERLPRPTGDRVPGVGELRGVEGEEALWQEERDSKEEELSSDKVRGASCVSVKKTEIYRYWSHQKIVVRKLCTAVFFFKIYY
jgi:hypothetical protein